MKGMAFNTVILLKADMVVMRMKIMQKTDNLFATLEKLVEY